MLRAIVIAVAAILVCAGIVLTARGLSMPGGQLLGLGLVVLAGTLFERWRYRRTAGSAQGPWQKTNERFIDPTTGDAMEVLFDPATGERRYVVEKSRHPSDPPP
jgi:hypothetical protein